MLVMVFAGLIAQELDSKRCFQAKLIWIRASVITSRSYQATQRYASSLSSVEWVAEAPSSGRGRSLPLDDFGTLRFDHASAVQDDQTITIAQSGAQAITMITPGGLHLAEPSDLSADGTSFTVTRTSTPSPSSSPRRRP